MEDFKKRVNDSFKEEILKIARESLAKQKADQAAEIKKAEEDRQKEIERVKNGMITWIIFITIRNYEAIC